MAGFGKRLLNFLGDEDRALAALFGAEWFQTISGTAGRAAGYAGGRHQWWGPLVVALIDGIPCFGEGHCKRWAEEEARMSVGLEPAA